MGSSPTRSMCPRGETDYHTVLRTQSHGFKSCRGYRACSSNWQNACPASRMMSVQIRPGPLCPRTSAEDWLSYKESDGGSNPSAGI